MEMKRREVARMCAFSGRLVSRQSRTSLSRSAQGILCMLSLIFVAALTPNSNEGSIGTSQAIIAACSAPADAPPILEGMLIVIILLYISLSNETKDKVNKVKTLVALIVLT